MLTKKGNHYKTLLHMQLTDNLMTVYISLSSNLLGDIDQVAIDKAIPLISERIQSEKKPASTLEKNLHRIEHHREQLRDAYMDLWQSYFYMVTPQTRETSAAKAASAVEEARYAMLRSIPDDKMLRSFCAVTIGEDAASEFILPDEREQLIKAAVTTMSTTKE